MSGIHLPLSFFGLFFFNLSALQFLTLSQTLLISCAKDYVGVASASMVITAKFIGRGISGSIPYYEDACAVSNHNLITHLVDTVN